MIRTQYKIIPSTPEGMNHFGDLAVDGTIILELIKNLGGECILDFHLAKDEGHFEKGNDASGFIKDRELFFSS